MAVSDLVATQDQIQKYWSPRFTKELREALLLGALVNKDYEGAIARGGDTVRVSQVNAPSGQLLTIGTNADSFSPEAISLSKVDLVVDKRAVASYEFQDLVDLQTQLSKENPEVMESMKFAMAKQINDYLYSLVSPSTSAPDHEIASVSDFNSSQLGSVRVLAATAKWRMEPGWYGLLSPQYYQDLMNATTIASSDFGATDAPTVSGQLALKRYGFNLFEDNSRSGDYGLFFHPDFLHMVMQQAVQVKISDQHAQKKFGYVMSVDLIFGAKLGINGNVKHIRVQN